MNSENSARPAGQAQTLRFQNVVNWIMTKVLRSPLAAGPGRALILLHVVGRKSGQRYDVPVAYATDGDDLVIGTPFAWARNLRTGEPIQVHYMGKQGSADVEVHTDFDNVASDYAILCRTNKNFASFNNIRRGADGTPDPTDLRAAWEQGARSIRLRIRE
jgi:hypothetical protein